VLISKPSAKAVEPATRARATERANFTIVFILLLLLSSYEHSPLLSLFTLYTILLTKSRRK
jgi:hypothetical protein